MRTMLNLDINADSQVIHKKTNEFLVDYMSGEVFSFVLCIS